MEQATSKIEKVKQRVGFIHSPLVAWLILLFSVIITLVAYLYSTSVSQARIEERFQFRANEIAQAVVDRLQVYEQVLWSGVALFDASNNITREEWRAFVATLDIEEHWPGIQGMGFALPLTEQEVARHIADIHAQGFENYKIYPEFDRDFYTSIIYLEPFDWRNQRAFGYDMWTNDLRRKAMSRTRDQGVATLSGMITLVQETAQNTQYGFLSYVPVYKKGTPADADVETRRRNFVGWVFAPFRVKDFFSGILQGRDSDIAFAIYDGNQPSVKKLMYSSNKGYAIDDAGNVNVNADNQLWLTVENQGHPWTFHFYQLQNGGLKNGEHLPTIIASMGIALDALLFYVIISLHFITKHTDKAVEARTREIRKEKESIEQAYQQAEAEHRAVLEDLKQQIADSQGREQRIIELKKEVNALAHALGKEPPYTAGVD